MSHLDVERVLLRVTPSVLYVCRSYTDDAVDVVSVIFWVLEVQAGAAIATADALALVEEAGTDLVVRVELLCPLLGKLLGAGGLVLVGNLQGPQLIWIISGFSLSPSSYL